MGLKKDIKYLKEIKDDKELCKIVKKLPENEEVCKEMLKILQNEEVKIEKSSLEKGEASLYLVMSNSIVIGTKEENVTRIQTIAHECIHSIQNKRKLKIHFWISNCYQILFFFLILLFVFEQEKIINVIFLGIFAGISIITSIIRFSLEKDAMERAPELAKQYLEKTKLEKKKVEVLIKEYEKITKIGIPLYKCHLALSFMFRFVIISLFYLIF